MTLSFDVSSWSKFGPDEGSNSSSFPILYCSSNYISEDKIQEFFHFEEQGAVNIIHINFRSLKKNFDHVRLLLSNIKYPLTAVALTETWLTADLIYVYNIPGYKFVSQHRCDKFSGGVGFYVDNRLEFNTRSDICLSLSHIECLFLEIIQLGKVNILIGCVYRPPRTDVSAFKAELLKILITFDNERKKIILLAGDCNLDLLKFGHPPTYR